MTWRDLMLIGIGAALLTFAILMLPGCATKSPDAAVPVAVSCVPPATPAKPDVHAPEDIARAPTGPDRFALLSKDYPKLFGWSLSAGAVIEGCRNLP
jgi:hypothetical protein